MPSALNVAPRQHYRPSSRAPEWLRRIWNWL